MVSRLPQPVLRCAVVIGIILAGLGVFFSLLAIDPRHAAYAAADTPHLDHPDAVCRDCHREIYDRYQQTPMARGSGLAVDGLDAQQLAARDLVHEPSGVTYHVSLSGGQATLTYSRPATAARDGLEGDERLEYFVGSGHRGRTYLYNQQGLWFEAPINWYGKKQLWDMAPAFDNVRAMPAPLPVDPNCLHCHAGEVQPAAGPARNRYSDQPFRAGGVGCAACHGDPAAHLSQVRSQSNKGGDAHKPATLAEFQPVSAIVNPAKLDPARRDSICLQCHLEGDASVFLPGKSLQAFKPGEDLSDFVDYFIDRNKAELGLRASSQYEALLRSACRRAVGDRLTCTTCHDPHSSPAPSERVAFFRARCLACHTGNEIAVRHHPEQQDCAICHMPTRNTLDISHEQLTDHNIEAVPVETPSNALLRLSRKPVDLIRVGNLPVQDRELGLAYAQLAERGDRASGERALTLLHKAELAGSADTEVLNRLGLLLQLSGSSISAASHYQAALQEDANDITAAANLAVIDASSGKQAESIQLLSRVVQIDPSQTSAGLNLAFLECRGGQKQEALHVVTLMLEYNPDSTAAHRMLDTGFYGDQRCALR